jgi:hypothetical protein
VMDERQRQEMIKKLELLERLEKQGLIEDAERKARRYSESGDSERSRRWRRKASRLRGES